MNKEILTAYYNENKLDKLSYALKMLSKMEKIIDTNIDNATESDIDFFIKFLIAKKNNTLDVFVIMLRYFKLIDSIHIVNHISIYTKSYTIVHNIYGRIRDKSVVKNIKMPILGTPIKDYQSFISEFVQTLESRLTEPELKSVLIGNHQGINKLSFKKEKEFYDKAATLKSYLLGLHKRMVKELEESLNEDKLWKNQVITSDIVEYIKENKEINSAVLKKDKLYITKMPYNAEKYLNSTSSIEQRYYACDCIFVRENIINPLLYISPKWCYCSAGSIKQMFEYILDSYLPIDIISSALNKDKICRFVIDLTNIEYKK